MLIDLESLDVLVCQTQSSSGQDKQSADESLHRDCTTESMTRNHQGSCIRHEGEEYHNVSVDAMEVHELVS